MTDILYSCHLCNGKFVASNSDAEAEAEFEDRFGALPPGEELAVVCEVCYGRLSTLGYVPSVN